MQCFLRMIPETRLFALKRAAFRWSGASIGEGVRICSSFRVLGSGCFSVGDDTWIGHDVLVVASAEVSIGKCVDIGPRVFIGTGTHEIDPHGVRVAGKGISRSIAIGDGAWIGASACILPGVCIGSKAVVGAGALVREDVPEGVIVAGVPARVIGCLSDKA